VKTFDADKIRMIGLLYGEKNYDNTLSRFHTKPERNGRTDGQTDRRHRRTDRFAISISRVSVVVDNEDEFLWVSADPDLAGSDLINLDSEMETETSDSNWTNIEIVEMETYFSASSSEWSNQPVVNMMVQPEDSEALPAADLGLRTPGLLP